MAQFFLSASDSDALTRLSVLSGSASLAIVTHLGETAIEVSAFTAKSFIELTEIGDVADSEVLLQISAPASAENGSIPSGGAGARGNSTGDAYTSQTFSNSVSVLIIFRQDGTRSNLAFEWAGFAPGQNAIFHNRKLITSGSDIKGKIWPIGDPEPSTFNLESTNAELTSGRVGISCGRSLDTFYVSAIGVGTNGDPAPTGPVATGPATPINLGVSNLQATSARLTWEQG